MKTRVLLAALGSMALLGFSANVWAVDHQVIAVDLVGLGAATEATGTAHVVNDPLGPDTLFLEMAGLPANARITVFLAEHPTPGGLPARFLGGFTTNQHGRGRLRLLAEVVDAVATAHLPRQDAIGGALDEKSEAPSSGVRFTAEDAAAPIPLDWLRGYMVDPSGFHTFGADEHTLGGTPVFVSTSPLPSQAGSPQKPTL